MLTLIPPVLLLQGLLHKDWKSAAFFSLAVAVGLTPEMLPMVLTTALSRGAYLMSQKKCIVKSLDSIINLGGMDVLCTDKTGTLTENRLTLVKAVDCSGQTSLLPTQLAFLNSTFQTNGSDNVMDVAVIKFFESYEACIKQGERSLGAEFTKIDEIPFDFTRRRASVLVKSESGTILISKGAFEEMLTVCTHACPSSPSQAFHPLSLPGTDTCQPLRADMIDTLYYLNSKFSQKGFRVLVVAFKTLPSIPETLSQADEANMTMAGFIAFQDPPKESALPAIKLMLEQNLSVKVLTGDSAEVCQKICEDIRLPICSIVTAKDLEVASEEEMYELAEYGTIFAKLTPLQKADLVRALKRRDHVVGFLGDGINDAPALVEADVGISVDNGTDIAREAADIILLEKDLLVVAEGIVEGRRTYGNTMKYLVMAISSNFGNCFSVVVASSWLPFLPMLPLQILVQNLIYDISQIAIPWDNVDKEYLQVN
jgi:Mg2+-importing ATPase